MLSPPCKSRDRIALPFARSGGLYVWRVLLRDACSYTPRARAMAVHASRSHHHVGVMSPRDAAACLHRRLHLGET
eukprot:3823094-Pleurochrysis_carterae.AAC.1